MMHPILERLAARRAGEIVVVRINVEYHPELAREFGVQGVPTFVIVKKGAEMGRTVGAMDESSFALWAASRS
jgi:thioredoxin-like negative regulator of GroEL